MLSKPNTIVYLRRNDLIVGGKHISPGKLAFTPDLIANMEVINSDVFIGTCQSFFIDHDFKDKKVLIVMDQKIVFSKSIDISGLDRLEIDAKIEAYIAKMPFPTGQRSCIEFLQDKELVMYATNTELYQSIIEALRLAGANKVVAISPSEAFDIDFTAKSSEVVNQFLEDKKVRNVVNFSTTNVY